MKIFMTSRKEFLLLVQLIVLTSTGGYTTVLMQVSPATHIFVTTNKMRLTVAELRTYNVTTPDQLKFNRHTLFTNDKMVSSKLFPLQCKTC